MEGRSKGSRLMGEGVVRSILEMGEEKEERDQRGSCGM